MEKAMDEFEMDSKEVRYTGNMTHKDRHHSEKRPFLNATAGESRKWILHMIHRAYHATDQLHKIIYYVKKCKNWMTGDSYQEIWH